MGRRRRNFHCRDGTNAGNVQNVAPQGKLFVLRSKLAQQGKNFMWKLVQLHKKAIDLTPLPNGPSDMVRHEPKGKKM